MFSLKGPHSTLDRATGTLQIPHGLENVILGQIKMQEYSAFPLVRNAKGPLDFLNNLFSTGFGSNDTPLGVSEELIVVTRNRFLFGFDNVIPESGEHIYRTAFNAGTFFRRPARSELTPELEQAVLSTTMDLVGMDNKGLCALFNGVGLCSDVLALAAIMFYSAQERGAWRDIKVEGVRFNHIEGENDHCFLRLSRSSSAEKEIVYCDPWMRISVGLNPGETEHQLRERYLSAFIEFCHKRVVPGTYREYMMKLDSKTLQLYDKFTFEPINLPDWDNVKDAVEATANMARYTLTTEQPKERPDTSP